MAEEAKDEVDVLGTPQRSGKCGVNLGYQVTKVSLISGEEYYLYITGYGDMFNYDSASDVPWKDYKDLIEEIVISPDVTSIGDYAFMNFSYLKTVDFGYKSKIKSIGDYAFSGCSKITNLDSMPTLETIGTRAFTACSNLKQIPTSGVLKTIQSEAFSGCTGLTTVTVPDTVTALGASLFDNCYNITELTLPFIQNHLGNYINCGTAYSYTAIEQYNADGKSTTYRIPSGLKKVTITKANQIPAGAFSNCTGMEISVSGEYMTVGAYAFYQSSLTDITLSEHVTEIGETAFYGCSGLTSIVIPSSVKAIGSSAFKNCSGLTKIEIKEGVTSIGEYAFRGMTSLTKITIPKSVTTIGKGALYGCNSLVELTIPFVGETDTSETAYFLGHIFDTPSPTSNLSYIPKTLVTVRVTNATSLKSNAFYACTGITDIYLPATLTTIEEDVFSNCSDSLTIHYASGSANWQKITGHENVTHKVVFELKSLTDSSASVGTISAKTYTGSAIKPTVTVKYGTTTLVSGTDYTISYTNNINAGTATATIKGKGNYTGTVTRKFTINRKSLSGSGMTFGTISSKTYTGSAVKAVPSVKYNSTALVKDTDFTVTYSNNINVGTATVKVTGTGNYTGTKSITYKIIPRTVTISSIANGNSGITIKWGKRSEAGSYLVYRATGSTGTYKLIKTISSNATVSYTDTSVIPGNTYCYKIKSRKTISGVNFDSSYSTVKSLKSSFGTTTLTYSVLGSGNKLSWTKKSVGTGYVVYRSTSSTTGYKAIKTITSNATVSYTDTGVSYGKTYYYKVRPYKTKSDGTKVYGSYSAVAKVLSRKLTTPSLSLTSGKTTYNGKQVTLVKISWAAVSNAEGYEIVRTNPDGSTSPFKTDKLTVNNYVSRSGTYKYKVRAYRTVNSKTYYSAYSASKTATVS
ncbi:MAG: leucine-rich repeat protein [Clostridia bacterium]|nr:leucine-rich repeat protein [Clostridia bacterium]